jgi:hypothetical protein
MSGEASLSFSDDAMQLQGVVDFTNAVALQDQGDAWLRERHRRSAASTWAV